MDHYQFDILTEDIEELGKYLKEIAEQLKIMNKTLTTINLKEPQIDPKR
ncbi:MAG TPA: hypothetical protein PKZ88_08265 [Methanothermobacter sp.]|nr:hypothetical protein [Methanothermobacter sp.]